MSEFTWYSRLVLWIGALMLLVEAVSGRSEAFITVVATLCLAGGLAAFLIGLTGAGSSSPVDTTERRGSAPSDDRSTP